MILSTLAINSADGQFISAIVMDPQAADADPEINNEPMNPIDPINVNLNKRYNLQYVLLNVSINEIMVSPYIKLVGTTSLNLVLFRTKKNQGNEFFHFHNFSVDGNNPYA